MNHYVVHQPQLSKRAKEEHLEQLEQSVRNLIEVLEEPCTEQTKALHIRRVAAYLQIVKDLVRYH